jgi:uncharacterized protein (TIGR03083 family)
MAVWDRGRMRRRHQVYRSWLAEEGGALAAALDGDPTTAVPCCPGWTVADLAAHVGSQHRWVADLLDDAAREPRAPYSLRPGPGQTPADWCRAGLDLLLDAVDAVDPDTPMWTVTVERRAGAWCRRQAHDTAVHRWDAQDARGHADPVDAERAADFIDELFEAALPRILPLLGRPAPEAGLALRSADGSYSRRVDGAGGRPRLSDGGGRPADAVLTGTPSDLLLALWRRTGDAVLTGDPAALRAWQEAVDG